MERKPERQLMVTNPVNYKGELGKSEICSTKHWKCRDDVYVVNGIVEKADGTFLEGFHFNEIKEAGE